MKDEDWLSRNETAAASSSAFPFFLSGCLAALASFFSGVPKIFEARGVSVIEGAIAFTLIVGASSAASALVMPSTAPLEADTNA